MLALLVLAGAAHAMQPQAVATGFRTLFSTGDRNNTFFDASLDKRAQALTLLFAIGTLSLAIYFCLFNLSEMPEFGSSITPEFRLSTFAFIGLYAIALFLIRTALQIFTGFTFLPKNTVETLRGHYYHLTCCTAFVHYPVLLVSLFVPGLSANIILLLNAAVIALYFLILLVKCCLIMVRSFRGLIYALIALITLEVCPFAGLILSARQLILQS